MKIAIHAARFAVGSLVVALFGGVVFGTMWAIEYLPARVWEYIAVAFSMAMLVVMCYVAGMEILRELQN